MLALPDSGGLAPMRRRKPLAALGGFPNDVMLQQKAVAQAHRPPPMPPGGVPGLQGATPQIAAPGVVQPGLEGAPPPMPPGMPPGMPPHGGPEGGPTEYPPNPMPNTKLPWPISGSKVQPGPMPPGALGMPVRNDVRPVPGAIAARKPMARFGLAVASRRRRPMPPTMPPGY